MVSRLFFKLDGKDYQVDISQPYGGSGGGSAYDEDSIEVKVPEELKRIVHYGQFREAAEEYYRGVIGPVGGMNIRMQHNVFVIPFIARIEKAGDSGGW